MSSQQLLSADALASGGYASRQLFSRSRIIAWSHTRRFAAARHIVAPYAGGSLLDYGCGDGTFLFLVRDLFPTAHGIDADPKQVQSCRARLSKSTALSFSLVREMRREAPCRTYDVIVCMEVLEHCTDAALSEVLHDVRTFLAPGGTFIVSVPVETGLTLIAKQAVRLFAGWRRIGDYQFTERYTKRELARMVRGGERAAIVRPLYEAQVTPEVSLSFHGHKGFNWRRVRQRLAEEFTIRQQRFSPISWLPAIASQVWFICSASKPGSYR